MHMPTLTKLHLCNHAITQPSTTSRNSHLRGRQIGLCCTASTSVVSLLFRTELLLWPQRSDLMLLPQSAISECVLVWWSSWQIRQPFFPFQSANTEVAETPTAEHNQSDRYLCPLTLPQSSFEKEVDPSPILIHQILSCIFADVLN